jgi:hypothetical protein
LHTGVTANAHSGRVTPNGKGSIKAIHDITSCRTVSTNLTYLFIFNIRSPLYYWKIINNIMTQ